MARTLAPEALYSNESFDNHRLYSSGDIPRFEGTLEHIRTNDPDGSKAKKVMRSLERQTALESAKSNR